MAGITRIGPLASVKRWLSNTVDEGYQATRAGKNYQETKSAYDKLPAPMKTPAKTKEVQRAKERVKTERGQFVGALLQNRQYDMSGKQIKAKKKKK